MVTRTMLVLDKLATLLLGLALLVGGAAACWWWSGSSIDVLGGTLPPTSDTAAPSDVVARDWYPWASVAVGVVLVVIGLLWVLRHLRRTGVRRVALGGSDTSGRLQVAASEAAGAAATALSGTIGVRSASGAVVRDRGQLVARMSAVIDADADLALVARRCDEVSGQLRQVLERDDLRCRVELRVGR